MTLIDYTERINQLTERLSKGVVERIIVPSANELLAEIKNRVVRDGKDSNGGKIGNYSTKPSYYTREQFDKRSSFNARGKKDKGAFKNGNQRKSMYFTQGYKGLRDAQGKPTESINLNYSGSTMVAYQQSSDNNGVVQGMSTRKASEIRKGNEERLGKPIYKASNIELEKYNKRVLNEFHSANINILKGVSE